MRYQNMGVFDGGMVLSGSQIPAASGGKVQVMDSNAIASGGAFLQSELEKRDNLVRTPLTSITYPRDITVRVGGGWAEFVSAMQVNYGVAGGSGDNLVHAAGATGIPMIQADFGKDLWKTHIFSIGMRVMWLDIQRGNLTGRSYETLLRDGIRMAYDKHMEENVYAGIGKYGTTGLLNNENITIQNAASTGTEKSTKFKDKAPDLILEDINGAILSVWEACEHDRDAIPNHILLPYEQFNRLATTRISDLAEKTALQFLLDNNVAKANGGDLYIGAASWCKGAGVGGTDRMVVYVNKEKYLAVDELVPLNRVMTQANATEVCYDTPYMGNLSEVQSFYDQAMCYVDGRNVYSQ